MQFNDNAQLDASQVSTAKGGGRVAVGGGVSILVVILALIFGINPAELTGSTGTDQSASGGIDVSNCQTGADIKSNENCRFVAYTNSVNAYWAQTMKGYTPAQTVLFSGSTSTGCGQATTDVGPFYCPNDKKTYIDPSFTQDMLQNELGGQGGEAAEAYVIGHEYGHHVQDLLGTLDKVQSQGNTTGANSGQVALELQADCYAGSYLKHAASMPNSPIGALNQDDLNRMVNAAQVVGDDYIQKRMQGTVNPDAWTHGSSQMRQHWLAIGYNTGDPSQCNTFGTNG